MCMTETVYPNLIVGNDTKDDAAVVDLGNGTGIVSTTDFFMPIVDIQICLVESLQLTLFQTCTLWVGLRYGNCYSRVAH